MYLGVLVGKKSPVPKIKLLKENRQLPVPVDELSLRFRHCLLQFPPVNHTAIVSLAKVAVILGSAGAFLDT